MKDDLEDKYKHDLKLTLVNMPVFMNDYINCTNRELELRTQLAYATDIKLFLEFLSEKKLDKPLIEITLQDLNLVTEQMAREFLDSIDKYTKTYINKKGDTYTRTYRNSRTGICRKVATMKSFYRFLMSKKWVETDPFYNINPKTPKKENINPRLSKEDLKELEDVIDLNKQVDFNTPLEEKAYQRHKNRDLAMILLLAYTGIRVSELVQLDIQDINFKTSKIRVLRKGGKVSDVPFPDVIAESLHEYIKERNSKTITNNALFISQFKKRITAESVRNVLKKFVGRTDIPVKTTCHTLRRTFLTSLYNLTGDLELVRQMAGHETSETTRKFYAALDDNRFSDTVQNFSYTNL